MAPEGTSDTFDFSIPAILPKGELEVIAETASYGELTLCFVQPEPGIPLAGRWTIAVGPRRRMKRCPGSSHQRAQPEGCAPLAEHPSLAPP